MSNLLKSLLVAFTSLTLAAGNAYADDSGGDCPDHTNNCHDNGG